PVRVAVAQAIFLLNDDKMIDALLGQLPLERDADVRIAITRALPPTRDLRVVEPMLALFHDPSPAVVETVAMGPADKDLAPLSQKKPELAQRVVRELRD